MKVARWVTPSFLSSMPNCCPSSRYFGKAAEYCFVSQPALSMQIQRLETQLGVKLLKRTNKKYY